ncbi:MAG: C10 family peptidase [Bacteroidales bacterium]|nr:C10 family peptidase [Bacteroidales bacterium]
MKRLLIFSLALLCGVFASARTLSQQEAAEYARKFFGNTTSSSIKQVWTGTSTESPAFYAFNHVGGGFVIISAEDAVTPVLGYSHTGSFRVEGMPSNIRGWFSGLEKDIKTVREKNIKAGNDVRAEWASIGAKTKGGASVVLETAEWGQGNPYNYYCDIPGGKAVTGCVATAMAIFMRYMEYPEHGMGSVPSYTTRTYGYKMTGYSIEDHNYDWSNMPLKSTDVKQAGDDAKHAIATLIHDCGMSVYMDYTSGGSGAGSYSPMVALAKNFGYSASMRHVAKNSIDDIYEYYALLKGEIDSDRPVLYSASDPGAGGHAFIIDGYDEDYMWRLNWGWSGSDNGFYTIDLKIPGSYQFSDRQVALIGAAPDPDKIDEASSNIMLDNYGLKLTSGQVGTEGEFVLTSDYVTNMGNADYSGNLVVVLVDKDDNIIEQLCKPQKAEIQKVSVEGYNYMYQFDFTCKLSKPLGFRDGIMLAYQVPGTEDYALTPYPHDGTVGRLGAIPYFIKLDKTEYKAGDTIYFKLTGGTEALSGAVWYYDGVKTAELLHTLTAGTHTIKAVLSKASGVKETLVQEIIVK